MLSVYGIAKVLIGVLAVLTVEMLPFEFIPKDVRVTGASIGYMIVFILSVMYIVKSKIVNYNWTFSKMCIAYFVYFLVIFGKIPFFYTDITENKAMKGMFIVAICCTIIFFIISRIERHNAEMERAKIEENNKKLSTKLHKSQEIIPAVVQILNDVTENSGKEMEEHETQKLLNEMTDLFGQQLKQNSKEDLQLKNFCSTGLKLLDQQLKVYQMEAVDRGVNFDIYVQAPISEIIKRENIDQLKLQRALGDLIRNAFRAIERNSNKCRAKGHVLLIIGCRYEGILEIAVVDNGAEFPLHVIEAFGRRGVTSWGTGNGLADTMEFAEETGASICVEEFDGKTNSFTKKVSMIFDKCRKNYYNSSRKELVGGSFWEKIEYL
ncbi:MAG: HAMP domain-containing histidine kinase [Lachnospiraceae bacterium]|nr:HAMP domain-containing histidine kinase [Lachnospiraceae bacterium]